MNGNEWGFPDMNIDRLYRSPSTITNYINTVKNIKDFDWLKIYRYNTSWCPSIRWFGYLYIYKKIPRFATKFLNLNTLLCNTEVLILKPVACFVLSLSTMLTQIPINYLIFFWTFHPEDTTVGDFKHYYNIKQCCHDLLYSGIQVGNIHSQFCDLSVLESDNYANYVKNFTKTTTTWDIPTIIYICTENFH